MEPAQIAELLKPFTSDSSTSGSSEIFAYCSPKSLADISIYIDLLLRWNARLNLTTIRQPEEIVTRHFGESLFAARILFPFPASESLADVGSGAGFPGLPIKIWTPSLKLTLIESKQRKATFLREAIRALALEDATVFAGRAQDFPPASADVVTLRAVEHFDEVLPVAAHLVSPAGRLALLIGQNQVPQAQAMLPAVQWIEPVLIPVSSNRVLLIGSRG